MLLLVLVQDAVLPLRLQFVFVVVVCWPYAATTQSTRRPTVDDLMTNRTSCLRDTMRGSPHQNEGALYSAYDRASYDRAWTILNARPIVWWMQDAITVRKNLGNRVRALREKRRWSQEELAHQSGLARSFTGAIERGEKDLRLTTLVKLANTFKISIGKLFT